MQTSKKITGELTKSQLKYNKQGKIVKDAIHCLKRKCIEVRNT